MEKILLTSDEGYFKCCERRIIGFMDCNGSAVATNVDADCEYENCEYSKKLEGWGDAIFSVEFKPTHYPCVMVISHDTDFYNYACTNVMFVYQDDFEPKK